MTASQGAAAGLLVLLALTGCAAQRTTRFAALTNVVVCKHCNCLMPADADPDSECTVCNCHRRAHACALGGRGGGAQCPLRRAARN